MGWVTPPTFSVGAILTALQMNDISGDLTELGTGAGFPLHGRGTALVGSGRPAAGTPAFQLNAGTAVVSTGSTGLVVFGWPNPFSHGVLCVIATSGTRGSGSAAAYFTTKPSTISTTDYKGTAWKTTGNTVASSTNVRITFFAIGW